jgi:hypothetical protein
MDVRCRYLEEATDTGTYPAWTWTGITADSYAYTTDLCNYQPACGQFSTMYILYDVAPCPAPNRTVNLGFPTNELSNTTYPGSIWDDMGCAVPVGTTFVPEATAAGLNCGSTDGVTLAVAYSTLTVPVMPGPASFTTANPVSNTRWLRWTVPVAGVQTTGCACFRVAIN